MPTIKEDAQDYEPKMTKNIADLEIVSIDLKTEDRDGINSEGKAFKYKVTVIDGEEYRVPNSVLKSLKAILKEKPDLETFKVLKDGEGLLTNYTVVPTI